MPPGYWVFLTVESIMRYININTVERDAKMLPVWNRTKCGLSSVEKLNSKLPQLDLSDASVIYGNHFSSLSDTRS